MESVTEIVASALLVGYGIQLNQNVFAMLIKVLRWSMAIATTASLFLARMEYLFLMDVVVSTEISSHFHSFQLRVAQYLVLRILDSTSTIRFAELAQTRSYQQQRPKPNVKPAPQASL